MPAIKTTRLVPHDTVEGVVCDACGDHNNWSWLHVVHTFGYGTGLDTDTVEFALCDRCVGQIALAHIPGAAFRERDGAALPAHQALANLRAQGVAAPASSHEILDAVATLTAWAAGHPAREALLEAALRQPGAPSEGAPGNTAAGQP